MPASTIVMQAGHVAALCTPTSVVLAPAVAAMPAKHPDRRHIAAKCLVAGAILHGDAPGPYDDDEADAAAQILLDHTHPAEHHPWGG